MDCVSGVIYKKSSSKCYREFSLFSSKHFIVIYFTLNLYVKGKVMACAVRCSDAELYEFFIYPGY